MVGISDHLKESIRVLSLSAEEQIAYLRRLFGEDISVDELALDFEDALVSHQHLIDSGDISPELGRCLTDIDRLLDKISGESKASLWTEQSLRDGVEWRRIREVAERCLSLLEPS